MATDHLDKTIGEGLELTQQLNEHLEMHGPELVDEHATKADDLRARVRRKAIEIVLSAEHAQDALDRLNDAAGNASDPRHALGLRQSVEEVLSQEFSAPDGR